MTNPNHPHPDAGQTQGACQVTKQPKPASIIGLLFVGAPLLMAGCTSVPSLPTASNTPPIVAKYHPAHWEKIPEYEAPPGFAYNLVCDEGGKIIASLEIRGKTDFTVWGGDGNSHGEYSTFKAAKNSAEGLQGLALANEFILGRNLDICP